MAQIPVLTQTSGDARYPKSSPGIYVPAGWGSFWKPKLAAAGSGLAKIAVMGDSVSRGYYASDLTLKGYIGLLRTSLQTTFGDGGSGFRSVGDSTIHANVAAYTSQYVTLTGTWGNSTVGDGPGMSGIQSSTDGSTATAVVRGTKVGIWFLAQTGAGTFTVSIDGGSAVTVNTNTLAAGADKYEVTGLSAGNHTVVVTKTGTTRADLHGFYGENSTGVLINNFSKHGQTSGAATATAGFSNPGYYGGGPGYPADLAIWAMGVNDANAGATTPDTYLANFRKYVDQVREGGTTGGTAYTGTGAVDLLVVLPHFGKFDASQRGDAYAARLRAACEHYGAAFVDMNPIFRNSWAYFNSLNGWGVVNGSTTAGASGIDSVHPSDAGHLLYKNVLLPILSATT